MDMYINAGAIACQALVHFRWNLCEVHMYKQTWSSSILWSFKIVPIFEWQSLFKRDEALTCINVSWIWDIVIGLLPKHLQPIQQTPPLHSGCPWRFTRECKFGKVDSVNWIKCQETSPLRLKKAQRKYCLAKTIQGTFCFSQKKLHRTHPNSFRNVLEIQRKKQCVHLVFICWWFRLEPLTDPRRTENEDVRKVSWKFSWKKTCSSCYVEFL